jgi:glyoxylase-like metal-dependent hydrolase (beta-lactamase superfamily II)
MDNNAYLLRCRATGEQLLVDAAAEPDRLLSMIGTEGLAHVVTTHQHPDHTGALIEVLEATGARSLAHPADAGALPRPPDQLVVDGDIIGWGRCGATVIHLVGHTPGGIALLVDDPDGHPHLFTGDSLFPGGVGATRGDAAAFTTLLDDVERKIFDRLPDETWVYPGHGEDTTIGAERPHLAEWRARGW